ncbi:MAG TPA: inositol monophosphatase [Casimicrobiaceae bacterium]|jgi:myo-inositol-1(or 4)-monophosphatase|nr:inositol monophosphatase [Casimicrobiaceae bacterium]
MDAPALIAARFAFARDIAREAGALAMSHYRRPGGLAVESKGLQDVVTVADRAVETTLVARIAKAFPGDVVLGEEGGYSAAYDGSAPLWVIDPIDGTANFARGLPLWCISIGIVHRGRAMAGVIYNAVTDEMHAGSVDMPATCNDRPIRVSRVDDPHHARVNLGFSYRRDPAIHVAGIARLLAAGCEYSRLGSGALGMAYVADGRFEGYFEPHINAWDVAAGIAIVEAAGGTCNDFFAGDALDRGNAILAAAPGVHDFLVRELWSTLPTPTEP